MNANGIKNSYHVDTSMLSLAETGRQSTTNSYASALANAKMNTD